MDEDECKLPLSEDKKRWRVLYPAYINKKFKLAEGRKIASEHCVENPNISEIAEICAFLKFPCKIEAKTYSRDFLTRGRVRVLMNNDDGSPLREDIQTRKQLMKFCGEKIPNLKSRLKPQPTTDPTALPVTGAAGKTTEPSPKKSEGGNKKKGRKKKGRR